MSETVVAAAPAVTTTRLERELADHREALLAFITAAEHLAAEAWNAARPGDKWSPAQIAEHLRLTYAVARAEIAGQGGMRVRTKWWQRRLFRFLYLPAILSKGRFPKGAPAVRKIRPGDGPFERAALLAALRSEGEAFFAAVRESGAGKAKITHPFLGPLGAEDGVRFLTQHIRHHQAQVGA